VSAARKNGTKIRLTPRERLTRGLTYTAVGPVDITRGTVGLGWLGARSAAGRARARHEKARLAKELGVALGAPPARGGESISKELAAAQEVIASLPEAFAEARKPKRRKLPWIIAAGVVAIAAGGVAFSIVRRSMQPEPSPRPPSVDIEPKP
jgi:cell wall synthesis protein CwsA